jgi:predicted transcriptional regulator
MNAQTKVVTTHIPLSLAEKLDKAAARMDRSRGWVMKQALADWLDLEEERHKMTLEGLADVDAGRVIAHEDMLAWARSLGSDNPLPRPTA